MPGDAHGVPQALIDRLDQMDAEMQYVFSHYTDRKVPPPARRKPVTVIRFTTAVRNHDDVYIPGPLAYVAAEAIHAISYLDHLVPSSEFGAVPVVCLHSALARLPQAAVLDAELRNDLRVAGWDLDELT